LLLNFHITSLITPAIVYVRQLQNRSKVT